MKAIISDFMIICVYVDDLLVIGSSTVEIEELKRRNLLEFEMTGLRLLSYILGIEFLSICYGVFMHQKEIWN